MKTWKEYLIEKSGVFDIDNVDELEREVINFLKQKKATNPNNSLYLDDVLDTASSNNFFNWLNNKYSKLNLGSAPNKKLEKILKTSNVINSRKSRNGVSIWV